MYRKKLAIPCLLVAASATSAHAGTMINPIDRGQFNQNGEHIPDMNAGIGHSEEDANVFRSFFVFDTISLAGSTVTSVELKLQVIEYIGAVGGSLDFDVYDVSPSSNLGVAYLSGSPEGMDVFADLGTGSLYGQAVVSETGTRLIDVSLSTQAVTDLNFAIAHSMQFAVGLSLNGPFLNTEGLIFSFPPFLGTHAINVEAVNTVPEPTSLAIFGALGLAAAGLRRRKQKQTL